MKKYLIIPLFAIAMSANLPAQEASLELPASGKSGVVAKPTDPTVVEPESKPKKELSENDKIYISAQRFLNGINTEVNYHEALVRFDYLAGLGDARAMNALAGMLRQGMGVSEDRSAARELYARASALGYGKASYNLAQMYKTAQGGEQDFGKAFEYNRLALEQGYKPAIYMLGYLHYKGLGTPQNYAEAVRYFSEGVKLKFSSSTYFLGLCYLGGYGVEKNAEKGKQLIEQAAAWGNDHAVEFIVNGDDEKYTHFGNTDPQGKPYPAYRKISTNEATIDLSGTWTGRILKYDWSGKQVTQDSKLTLQLNQSTNNPINTLSGSWLQADTLAMTVQATQQADQWQTENMQYMLTWDRTYFVQNLRFAAEIDATGDTVLYAALEQFSPQTVEPASPAMIELRKARVGADLQSVPNMEQSVPETTFAVYPNPFSNELNVQINTTKAQTATLLLYDLSGRIIKTETVETGRISTTLNNRIVSLQTAHLPAGTYVVSVKGEGLNLNTVVIKK